MVGQTDGWASRWLGRQMVGQTDGNTDILIISWIYKQVVGQTDGWIDRWLNRQNSQKDEPKNEWTDGQTDGW
jgi:hypothetical protein